MPAVQITFSRALKIWWSFAWRAGVLLFPAMLVLDAAFFFVLPFPKLGQPPDPSHMPGFMLRIFGAWIVVMGVTVLLQAQAMRWMLGTRWADFRLEAVSET